MAKKKGGGKKGGKGKKGPVDWAAQPRETYVDLDVRSSVWKTMRFTQRLNAATRLQQVVELIMDRHSIPGPHGLTLFLVDHLGRRSKVDEEEYELALKDVNVPSGSINDHVLQVLEYEYEAHKSGETLDANNVPSGRNYGLVNLPRDMIQPPLRQLGTA
jgi:hypothetical protein